MEKLVTITKVTVIMMTYRRNSIEKKKLLMSQILNGNIKTNTFTSNSFIDHYPRNG